MIDFLTEDQPQAVPLWPVTAVSLALWRAEHPAAASWVESSGFAAAPGRVLLLPSPEGRLAGALLGVPETPDLWSFGGLSEALPEGLYRLTPEPEAGVATAAALGFALGAYRFRRYLKAAPPPGPSLVWPTHADRAEVERTVRAITLARDLVNTPASDLGPEALARAAEALAEAHGATCRILVGPALLTENFPLVHAVGRAAAEAPRLVDIAWGRAGAPRVTLVGKGVCFDSGGLDLKPASAMALMKKDMGGAANILGLAHMVMAAGLDLRLRVLIPAVENAVSGNAFRPGDILASRLGLSVEIGNTDAEGRLILADALAAADEEAPELLIDCATLTGAARVALGPDLPALFTDDEALAADLARHASVQSDPMWRLPLFEPYRALLDSRIADLNNAPEGSFAGAITAALFLKSFVTRAKSFAHFDLYAWNPKARPGRPQGGEAMAIRALFALLAERYPAVTRPPA